MDIMLYFGESRRRYGIYGEGKDNENVKKLLQYMSFGIKY